MAYKFLEHTADIKFLAWGGNLEEVFISSAEALKEVISEGTKVHEDKVKELFVEGKDLESLLYSFLEEFIYLLDAENFLISKVVSVKIEIKNGRYYLKAEIHGDSADKYGISNNVKAVTYNEMFIKENNEEKNVSRRWSAQAVLDV